MNCINRNTQEFKELLEASKLPSLLLEMRVSKWQEANGLDTFPQISDIVQSEEINNKLKTFFKGFGFTIKQGENSTDLLKKIIYVNEEDDNLFIDNSVKALSKLLLSNTNIDFNKLENLIEETEEFKTLLNNSTQYIQDTHKFLKDGNRIPMPEWISYINEYNKIKNEVIEKYIKESLLDKNNSTKLHQLINDFIQWFKDLFNNANSLKEVTDNLVVLVLNNERQLIINSNDLKNKERVSLRKALDETSHGKDIIKTFSDFGLILTGSVSAAEQGSVFRKTGKLLHDIDWVVTKDFKGDYVKELKDNFNGATLVREFDSSTYYTHTFIVPPKGYNISNLTFFKPEVYGATKFISSYDVIDNDGNVISNYRRYYDVKESGKVIENREVYNEGLENVDKNLEAVSVDFFQNKKELEFEPYTVEIEGFKIQLSNWLSSFTEKLKYGRAKDLLDYANFIPNEVEENNLNQESNKNIQDLVDSNVENIFPGIISNVLESITPDYSAEHNRILFNDKQGKFTVDEILQNIINNYDNFSKEGKTLFEKAVKLMGKSGAKFQFVSEDVLLNEDTLMQYSGTTNTIQVNRKRLSTSNPDLVIETFIHEVVHAQTVKALSNPQTFEEKDFYELVQTNFLDFKDSTMSKSYGFTDVYEFVAEIYANPEFREELRRIKPNATKSFWKDFISAIRRMFGLTNTRSANEVIEAVIEFTEQDRRYVNNNTSGIFQKIVDKPSFISLESNLSYLVNVAKDRMDQAKNRAKKTGKKITKKERKENLDNIIKLIDEMESFDELNQWKAIIAYTNGLAQKVNSLKISFDKKDISKDGLIDMINNYEDYLASFDLLPDIRDLIEYANESQLSNEAKEDVKKLDDLIRTFEGNHARLISRFKIAKERQSIYLLSDPRFNTIVETKNRLRLEKEYKDLNITGESRSEYVSRMMSTRDKDLIQEELRASAERLAKDPSFDISKTEGLLSDPLNTNSRLIEVVTNIIANVREAIISQFNIKNAELGKLYDKFIKEKGNSRPSELYKNLYEQDSEGNYWLKSEYSVKFLDVYRSELKPLRQKVIDLVEIYKGKGLTFKDYKLEQDYKDAVTAQNKWMKEHTIKDPSDNANVRWLPADKYKNPVLTGMDAELFYEFRSITVESATNTGNKQTLISKIDNFGDGIRFLQLPSHSKSDFERRLEMDVKGLTKDKWTDLTTIKADDIGYGEAVTNKGEALRHVRVHYRGKLDPNEQSLDLMTMYRYEYLNGINYREKTKQELNLNLIADISKGKKYIKTSVKSGLAMMNVFSKREKVTTFEGEFSEEYKRIKGIIESNIYDVMSYNAGKIGSLDVNKVSSAISGYTASVSMAFNIASGTANILNGTTQLFIESLGDKFISKKSLLKAEKKYTTDLPNIFADLSKASKTSFTNQVLRMFDTFGGFTPEQQMFLKNTISRKLISTETMNSFQDSGEHMMNSVLTMAVLDNLKVMNKDHKFINIKGEVVEESKAASLLDMLKKDENGQVYMDENVAYTNQNMNIDYHKGGKVHVNLLIKKKAHDLFGVYDPNFQNELYKTWYGKALMMFKKFFISGLQYRYKGISNSTKSKDDLTEDDLIYNSALKEYDEGTYTSLVRYFSQGVIPMLKNMKLAYATDYYNNMTEFEKANLKKATAELVATAVLLPALGMILAAAGADDDDDSTLWFWIYQSRRLESELSQFRNPIESARLIQNPVAGIRLIQNSLSFSYELLTPINFIPEDKENFFSYLDENTKGENILFKKGKKLLPIVSQFDKDWKNMHSFINKNK